MMIENFDDFCLWVYVIVDNIWQEIAPQFKRRCPAPVCSHSGSLTMVLVGECQDLFANIPSQSRLNRRRQLKDTFQLIHQAVLVLLDLARASRPVSSGTASVVGMGGIWGNMREIAQ